jgi:hypothetical protein
LTLTLLLTAALLGLAGTPHCAAMCGAACVAAAGGARGWPMAGFQLARVLSYSAAGALAAGSVQALASVAQWTPLLKPLWTGVHVAALMLGVWLLVRGSQPQWVRSLVPLHAVPAGAGSPVRWQVHARRSARAGVAGLLWAAWPCGLLQSAMVVAAVAADAPAGAAVMAAFAATSSLGLLAAPWALSALRLDASGITRRRMTRCAGALLAGASLWALGHGLWHQIAAWCAA